MSQPVQVPEERRSYKLLGHVVRRGIPVLALLGVLAAAYYVWQTWSAAPEPVAAAVPQEAVPVSVVVVEEETVPVRMRFLGQTAAAQEVEIRSRVNGYIQARTFREGERVAQGQKLFQIDSRPFEVELAQAQAALASAQATLERATSELNRSRQLATRGAISEEEILDWQTQQRVAAAAVQERQAQIAAAQLQLDYASVKSPITGMIGRALKDMGSYVDAGPNGLLAVVQQIDPIYVLYSVTEQEMLRFQRQLAAHQIVAPEIGQLELELTLADGSIYPYRGRINFIDVEVDQTTGTSLVRGEVPNPQGVLKPGQFIYAQVLGIERVDVVRVPQKSVTLSPIGASVFVVSPRNVVEARPITLGEWSGTEHWIVNEGLAPGDRVITDQLMMVRPGIPVTIAAAARSGDAADAAPTSTATHPAARAPGGDVR